MVVKGPAPQRLYALHELALRSASEGAPVERARADRAGPLRQVELVLWGLIIGARPRTAAVLEDDRRGRATPGERCAPFLDWGRPLRQLAQEDARPLWLATLLTTVSRTAYSW